MADAINQIGQDTMTVTAAPIGVTRPPVTTGELKNEFGQLNRKTVNRALFTVENQPVRWRADGVDPTGGFEDNFLDVGERLNWTDPNQDYRGPIEKIRFVLDTTATGSATVNVALFG
jgi:hypothetical protein